MSEDISITRADGANVMRFTRPDKKNALTSAMYAAMNRAIAEAEADVRVRAHVFIGSGGVFTSGNDVADFMARAQGRTDVVGPVMEFVLSLPAITKPMIAAVDGLAVGIGTTLLLHCDLVYATVTASLRTPFVDLGLVPEAGSSLLGPMRLGHVRAFELLAMGEPMTAEQALAAGLVNRIVPAVDLDSATMAAARRIALKPPEALSIARHLLRGDPDGVTARIREELTLFDARLTSPEAREAFQAFMEKRPPDFARVTKKG
jgi:enoyl-CoA hydratase/carnithine racemase